MAHISSAECEILSNKPCIPFILSSVASLAITSTKGQQFPVYRLNSSATLIKVSEVEFLQPLVFSVNVITPILISMSRKGFSPSQPQPASASATSASATMFFPNYQLTKENLSLKTDNICIDCLYQQLQSMKGAKKCFQLR